MEEEMRARITQAALVLARWAAVTVLMACSLLFVAYQI